MFKNALTLPLSAALLVAGPAAGDWTFPGASWETRAPAQLGMDAALLDDFRDEVGGNGPGVIVKNGYVVYSWGDQAANGKWASASKPVYSTLLLFALQEGAIASVDDRLIDLGWALQPADANLSFRHLANMVSGYGLVEEPGQAFGYNDYAIRLYWLALVESVCGSDLANQGAVAALFNDASRLGPLQFEDGNLFKLKNQVPLLNMTPRDFARLGWLWLNKGLWDGQQLLPASYFDDYVRAGLPASTPRTTGIDVDYLGIDTMGGGADQTSLGPGVYGFNWWFNKGGALFPDAPHDTYQANGHWNGEVLTVIPSLGIVAAWRQGSFGGENTWNVSMNEILAELAAAAAPTTVPALPGWAGVLTPAALLTATLWHLRRRCRLA